MAKVGYMVKQGDLVKSWKRRLFLLRENMQLIYYAVADRPDPKGTRYLPLILISSLPQSFVVVVVVVF